MKNKIVFLNLTILVLAMMAILLFGIKVNENSHKQNAEEEIVKLTKIYAENYNDKITKNVPDNVRVTVIDSDFMVIADSDDSQIIGTLHSDRQEIINASRGVDKVITRYSSSLKKNMVYYAQKVEVGDSYLYVRVSIPIQSVNGYVTKTIPTMIYVLLVALLVSIIASLVATNSLIRPLKEVKDSIAMLSSGKFYKVNVKTDDKEINEMLNEINEIGQKLQQSETMRSEFFANASHELKTPLTAIKGFNDIIAITTQEENTKNLSSKIDKEVTRIVVLINDMLNLSKLECSKKVNIEKVNLNEIATSVKESLANLISEKKAEVNINGEAFVEMEKEHAIELVKNLMENGVRYNNENGYVNVEIGETDGKVRLVVKDNGIGIDKQYQQRIFERFYRVDKSRSRETGGTGLGLSIVKHICVLYDAEISLYSEIGKGTEITIEFNK